MVLMENSDNFFKKPMKCQVGKQNISCHFYKTTSEFCTMDGKGKSIEKQINSHRKTHKLWPLVLFVGSEVLNEIRESLPQDTALSQIRQSSCNFSKIHLFSLEFEICKFSKQKNGEANWLWCGKLIFSVCLHWFDTHFIYCWFCIYKYKEESRAHAGCSLQNGKHFCALWHHAFGSNPFWKVKKSGIVGQYYFVYPREALGREALDDGQLGRGTRTM